jgi:DNA-binding NarL/FixJ family response regulator
MKNKVGGQSVGVIERSAIGGRVISAPSDSTNATAGTEPQPTVIVVEKHRLILDCLIQGIRDTTGFMAFGAGTLEECLWLAEDQRPFLALIRVPSEFDFDASANFVGRAMRLLPGIPILFLSDRESPKLDFAMCDPRTVGYISTSTQLDVVMAAIRVVQASGEIPNTSQASSGPEMLPAPAKPGSIKFSNMFTARQAAVMDALRKGKSNKVIAYELKMKESTVKVHVRNIMKKLKAKNRTEVSYVAAQLEAGSGLSETLRRIPEIGVGIRIPEKVLPS